MAASAWLATSEHEGKVYGLQEELRRQHGSPCLPLLEKALQHGQQVRRCFHTSFLLSCPLPVVLARQKAQWEGAMLEWHVSPLIGWDMAVKPPAVLMTCLLFAG